MKAVLDTNVYVSLLIAPRGAGAWLMALWSERKYDLVISPALFTELIEVLGRPEIATHIEPERKLALFRRLRYDAEWTMESIEASSALPDPEDDFLIGAALEAEAGWIVTWDKQLLESGASRGVQILTPDQFIALVLRGER